MELRNFDIELMADISKEFSGAEIEQAIVEGMYRAFHEQRDVNTDDILGAIRETYPLASTAREQISFMQAWATQGRARSASKGLMDRDYASEKSSDKNLEKPLIQNLEDSAIEKNNQGEVNNEPVKLNGKLRPLPLPPLPEVKSN